MNRLAYKEISPTAYRALLSLEGHVRKSGLDRALLDLVYLRVSQINGCAFCVDMHDKDLRAAGETPERLALLAVWQEAPSFSPRERAALAYAEAVTRLGHDPVPDATYQAALAEFGDALLVELTLAIATINAWNRLGIAFRSPAGLYQPVARVTANGESGATRLHPLHARGELLVLPNVWDALSARIVEKAGARAIATSSAAVCWPHGYVDGEELPLDTLVATVASIARVVALPITVDLVRGYADAGAAVSRVVDAGAEGVNLEDACEPADVFAERIAAVRRRLGAHVFINARTCIVLRGVVPAQRVVEEVLARARIYEEAGADGLFVPKLVDGPAISAIVSGTCLPLNLMLVPGLPPLDTLRALGVRRLSVAARLADVAYAAARSAATALLDRGSYDALTTCELGYPEVNALFAPREPRGLESRQ